MNEFLAKPVRKQQMVEAIVRVLDASAVSASCGVLPEWDVPGLSSDRGKPIHDPVLDTVVFEALVSEIGSDGTRETIGVFLQETESRIKRLRRLSNTAERQRIVTEAHTLKGASASLGLRELSGLARILEADATEAPESSVQRNIDSVAQAFARARETIAADPRMVA
ncbi:Hpt domain-containing protein [Rhodoplanes roseus]|uniref:HPt domain-containing protein n=1 Tax=Rhodoplanes roseus TaxID=29409 RepID=A0A327L0T6_9BRAD|nr:Hpt domain-containing protein [Rhodoplanes roseus]RAI43874.1 hypothetical protein CH341_12150 [Rhodoplanes roseus]